MRFLLLAGILLTVSFTMAQNSADPLPNHADIGNPKLKGATIYNKADQSYSMKGGGANIWGNRDEFHYAYNTLKGDFMLTANVKLMGVGKEAHRKIGWMVRASAQEDAAHMSATLHADGLTELQWRRMRGAYMRDPQDEIRTVKKNVGIIQLERIGKVFIMRIANFGEPLQEVGRTDLIEMPDSVMAGIFLCSHNADQIEEAQAWNVRIEKTVPETYNGYRDGILGNRMEIMNVFDGKRKIIHEDVAVRFEAPNWMPDGKRLLFNQSGSIYTIPIEGGTPEKLNTGGVNRNNNDHVISFDGKWLGLSSSRPNTGSTVYYVPITGGEPTLVTDSTPSYLHGWSPNGKEVVYTAQRISKEPAYNIYKKPIAGGPEVQLTFNKTGLADGPEYSPDGKYIYYNATQTGTMQLWRMKPDGSGQEQLTFDEYNNWFAHVSPDNKWIAFVSFPITVDPMDHPFYKRIMLRLMPVSGGAPKVIAYLYGGQGTINTPSWSPDSKRIAFVSNSKPLN
jgi:dipeptidyl aminopeptidase/acylaminoacyl peptidase